MDSQDKDEIETINATLASIIPYKERARKLHPVAAFAKSDDWYSYLINDWIVNEPDSDSLMKLFVHLHFHPTVFVGFVVHGAGYWEHPTFIKVES